MHLRHSVQLTPAPNSPPLQSRAIHAHIHAHSRRLNIVRNVYIIVHYREFRATDSPLRWSSRVTTRMGSGDSDHLISSSTSVHGTQCPTYHGLTHPGLAPSKATAMPYKLQYAYRNCHATDLTVGLVCPAEYLTFRQPPLSCNLAYTQTTATVMPPD